MRRSGALVLAAGALVLVGTAEPRSTTLTLADDYSDLMNDGEYAGAVPPISPDISGVSINRSFTGVVSVSVGVPNEPDHRSNSDLSLYMNTDRNNATGSGGYEFSITVSGATRSIRLDRWNGSAWGMVPAPSLQFLGWASGPSFTFDQAEIGSPASFNFLVAAIWTFPRAPYGDFAPNAGSWTFPSGSAGAVVTPPGPPPPPPDLKPPDTRLTAGPTGASSSRVATFRFASSEARSTFECKLDSGTWFACKSPKILRGLSRGLHVFRVRATDYVGNLDRSPAVRTWRVR